MNIREVSNLLTSCHLSNDCLLMEGKHGIGKSQIVEQWCKANDVHLEILFLSQMEVGDLIGLPRTIENDGELVTVWTKPIWKQRLDNASTAGKHCVLFLDELNRAPLDVRQSALQLVLEGKIHQHHLPVKDGIKTMIVAATNPSDIYQSDELDHALLDRFLFSSVEPDVEAWLEFARESKVPQVIRDYIIENPTRLHFMPKDGGSDQVSASPRSWTKLADHVKNFDKIPAEAHYPIIKGKIGEAVGSQFYQFLLSYSKVIKVEDVIKVADKAWKKTNNIEQTSEFVKDLIKDMEPVQKQEMCLNMIDMFHEKKDVKDAIPVMAFMYALPPETLMGVLKPMMTSKEPEIKEKFQKTVTFDEALNNKELFRRMVVGGSL